MGNFEGDIAFIITELREQEPKTREMSLAITKLEESLMWLQKHYDLLTTNKNE